MKNKELLVNGAPAGDMVIESYTQAEDMGDWEFAAYNAYGDANCDRDGIETLADLFGQEFSDKFYMHKDKLIAKYFLEKAEKRLENEKALIEHYKKVISGEIKPGVAKLPYPDEF